MKIGLVSPNFPPKICGVGDHSFFLAKELEKTQEVFLYTGTGAKPGKLCSLLRRDKPDVLLIQYTPYLYGHFYGLSLGLLLLMFFWRSRTKLVLMAHELHYPIQFSPAGLTIAPLQKLQFALLAALAHKVIFTYERPLEKYSGAKFHWLPVGSNIPVAEPSKPSATPLIVHFGGAHPTHLYDYVWDIAQKTKVPVYCLGIEKEALERWLGHRADSITCMPNLPPAEVSGWLHRATLVLAPFMDGNSSRRGSVMAAFAHGKAVLTTEGSSTNPNIVWKNFCRVTETNTLADYTNQALALLTQEEARNSLGNAARDFYEKNFSWPPIVSGLLQIISR